MCVVDKALIEIIIHAIAICCMNPQMPFTVFLNLVDNVVR